MIETHDLTKMYGELYALNRLNLTLNQGDVYGFIGPNGAGKTTTMRILATLLNPTWGEATVCGVFVETDPRTGLAVRIEPIRVGGRLKPAMPEA